MSKQGIVGSARAAAVIAASQLRGPSAAITLPAAVIAIGQMTVQNADLLSSAAKTAVAAVTKK
jgi:hypothetical protein